MADTREQVAALNASIRDRLIAAGVVDDDHAETTNAGQRIGVGDRVMTRRNNADLAVANRDNWTVTSVSSGGDVTIAGQHGDRTLPEGYAREYVELSYASTVYGVQGDTATATHTVIGDHTSAASAYVGMTRGREANVAHLVADSVEVAREQWVAVFARDRADLGPSHAGDLAAAEAARYASHRPLEQVLAELHRAWTVEQDCLDWLVRGEQRRDSLRGIVALRAARNRELPPLEHTYVQAHQTEREATRHAQMAHTTLAQATDRRRDAVLNAWDEQHAAIWSYAQTVRDGTGRFGYHRGAVASAGDQLNAWADAWRPDVPDLPTSVHAIADRVLSFENRPALWETLDHTARRHAEHHNPDAVAALAVAEHATNARQHPSRVFRDTDSHYQQALDQHGASARTEHPEQRLTELDSDLDAAQPRLTQAQSTITRLLGEPTVRTLPADQLTIERDSWHADRDTAAGQRRAESTQPDSDLSTNLRRSQSAHQRHIAPSAPDRSPGISR